jgi:hypothetical protein
MPEKKKKARVIKKEKKPVLAVKEPQLSWIPVFNRSLVELGVTYGALPVFLFLKGNSLLNMGCLILRSLRV